MVLWRRIFENKSDGASMISTLKWSLSSFSTAKGMPDSCLFVFNNLKCKKIVKFFLFSLIDKKHNFRNTVSGIEGLVSCPFCPYMTISGDINNQVTVKKIYFLWRSSGSVVDPWHIGTPTDPDKWLTDPDSSPHLALFVSGLYDGNKKYAK